jgi:hypothetical protein
MASFKTWHNLEDVTPGWTRLNRTIIVNIISTIHFEVLTCGDEINNSAVNFLIRCFCQYLRLASLVEKGLDVHSGASL